MVCTRKKNEPRTVGKLYGTRDAMTIKHKFSIASPNEKIKGVLI